MTVSQRQALLFYLGYYTGALDGDWGKGSRAGCQAFQRDYGLTADGLGGPVTDKALVGAVAGTVVPVRKPQSGQEAEDGPEWWKDIRYFTREEFRCKCCGRYCNGYPAEMQEAVVKIADEIRSRIGKPITVNSGLRCKTHNANVGGVSNSQHLYGTAADLGCPSGFTPSQMASIAEEIIGNTGAIGIYSWGIHIDTRSTKSRWNG